MDIAEGIKAYASYMAELYSMGRPLTSWEKDWVQESSLAVSARLDLDALEYEYKQRRRLPHMVKSLFTGGVAEMAKKLQQMIREYMAGEDPTPDVKAQKPPRGFLVDVYQADADQLPASSEVLERQLARQRRVQAYYRAQLEAMVDPSATKGSAKPWRGQYGPEGPGD